MPKIFIKLFIYVFLVALLAFRLYYSFTHLPHYKDGQKISFTATLSAEPEINTGRQQFSVKTPEGLKVSIVTTTSPLFHYGDKLFIEGIFTAKQYKNQTFWSIYFPKVQLSNSEQNIVSKMAVFIKTKANKLFEATLPPVSASLLSGMVFGGKQGMPADFMQNLRSVGVLHVIAASGMNVSFVAGALMYMLGAVMKRQLALTLGIVGIVFYAFLAGFEASIVRAAIMAIIAFSASLLGRQNFALLSVFVTGYLMLLLNPILLTDIGFQFSFLSTLGILLIKPLLPFGKNILLGDDIGTTLAAQLATVPLMLGIFGQYGVLSLLVNALVLWTIPFLMALGSLAVIIGFIFEPLAKVFLYLSLPLLFFFEKTVSFFGGAGWNVEVADFPVALTLGYYLLLGAGILLLRKRNAEKQGNKQINKQMKNE